MPTIANLVVVLEANTSRFAGPLSGVSRTLTRSVTLPLAAAGAASVSMAAKFDQSMRNVNSIMGVSEQRLATFSEQVLRMSTRFPQSAETLANGLYDIASSGFQGADAMKILDASARAASAGMTEAETASKAIVSVLNAYGLQAEDAARVSDILFRGVDKGVISFEELASTLGDYVGAASQLAIPIEDVVAAQAAMTLTGLNAAEAATSLNNVMRSLLKPSTDMTKALKAMGFESGQAALESIGLQGVIEGLADRVGDNKQEWLKLFPEIRSARGAMALAANDGEGLTRIMREMGDVTGATSRAFEEQSKGAMFQFTIALNQLKREAIKLGQELIPIITEDIIPAVRSAIKWWRGLSDESKALSLKLLGLAAVAGPLLGLVGVVIKIGSGIAMLTGRLLGLGSAGATAAAGTRTLGRSLGAWALALGEVAAAFIATRNYLNQDEDFAGQITSSLENSKSTIDDWARAIEGATDRENFLADTIDGDIKTFQAYDQAVEDANLRMSNMVASLGLMDGRFSDIATTIASTTSVTEKQKTAMLGNLSVLDRNNVALSESQRFTLRAYVATGNFTGAQRLLGRIVKSEVLEPLDRLKRNVDQVGGAMRGAETRAQLYNRELNRIPKNKHTRVTADISQAREALNTLLGLLGQVSGGAAIAVRAGINAVPEVHSGGRVGSGMSGETLRLLENGEFVIRKSVAQRPGMQAFLQGINRMHGGGRVGVPSLEELPTVQQLFGNGRGNDGRTRSWHDLLHNAAQAIRQITTPKEAQGWRQAMRAEMLRPGISRKQQGLIGVAMAALREETTAAEAEGWLKQIRRLDGRPWADARGFNFAEMVRGEFLAQLPKLATGGNIQRTGAALVHRGERVLSEAEQRRMVSLNVRLDRRHFAGQLAHDHEFRGW